MACILLFNRYNNLGGYGMKIRRLFKLTFFLFIVSATCLVSSGFSGEITRNRMNDINGPARWDVVQWTSGGATIVPSDSPEGGSMLQFRFPVGIRDGSDPANVFYVSSEALPETYLQFYHKYSSNYTYHPIANKLVYFYSPSGNRDSLGLFSVGYDDLAYYVWGNNQDITVYNLGFGRPQLGGWYKYNIHTKVNSSPGAHDGILQIWVNDVLKLNRSDIMWFAAGTTVTGWGQIDMAPAYGGEGGANPVLSYSYYDDFIISTTPISTGLPPTPISTGLPPNHPINLQIR
jgi:hypothetical protein